MSNDDINYNNDTKLIEKSLFSLYNSSCLNAIGLYKSLILNAHKMVSVILSKLYSAKIVFAHF